MLTIKFEAMILLVGILTNTYLFESKGRHMMGNFQGKETSIEFSSGDEGIVLTGTGDGASLCLSHLRRCYAAGQELQMAAVAVA